MSNPTSGGVIPPSSSGGGGGDVGATVSEVLAAINDGTRTLSPAGIVIGGDYTLKEGTNGRLQILQGSTLIQEQDDEGAWIAKSVRTGTGSVHLGDLHNNGSGGENVVWVNTDSNIAYFPSWGGLHIDGTSKFEMSDRVHDLTATSEPVGSAANVGSVEYAATVVATADVAFFFIDIVPSQNFSGRLRWRAEKTSNQKEVAEFFFDAVLVQDQIFKVPFKYPLWMAKDQSVDVAIYDDNNNLLQVRPGTNDNTKPYRRVHYTTFKDYNGLSAYVLLGE